jgi:hypothetical protein
MSIKSKLAKLEEQSSSKGQFALAASANYLLADIDDIDRQINLIGALHELGYLQNSLAPYWKEFRTDESAWVERCLSRLLTSDHDYWAVASLLGCSGPLTVKAAVAMGFKSIVLRFYERYDKPEVHINTLYLNAIGTVLNPILEIGYDSKDLSNVDIARARALSLDNEKWKPGARVGNGSFSYFMRAQLPHGSWRTVSTEFEIKQELLIKK